MGDVAFDVRLRLRLGDRRGVRVAVFSLPLLGTWFGGSADPELSLSEELSSDEPDEFEVASSSTLTLCVTAAFARCATAEAFVSPQQLGSLVFVLRISFGLSFAFALDAMQGITTSTIEQQKHA